MRPKTLLLTVLFSFSLLFHHAHADDLYPFESAQQEDMFVDLLTKLRCPKCQNQNLLDSNAEIAGDIKQRIYTMVHNGQSEEEIIQHLKTRYGDFISYDPPLNEHTFFIWFFPVVLFFGALIVMMYRIKKRFEAVEMQSVVTLMDDQTVDQSFDQGFDKSFDEWVKDEPVQDDNSQSARERTD